MSVEPISGPGTGYPAGAPPPAAPARRDFAALLQAHLGEPRAQLAEVRANIAAARSGRAPLPGSGPERVRPRGGTGGAGGADQALRLRNWSAHGTGPEDPYGWRALTRAIGEAAVAPGFGTLFERQIQQESGFDPAVVFGQRVSSAGAEGIAQLMPQYYPGVDRTDPQASLIAAADSMRHYLSAFQGDVRKALAAYNAGMGRVQQLVQAHGADWERALPLETRHYLAAIMGDADGRILPGGRGASTGVFGGRGPGGVLTPPLDLVLARVNEDGLLALRSNAGAEVRAPADGVVAAIRTGLLGAGLTIDNGNGWQTTLDGLGALRSAVGDHVSRGALLGTLGGGDGAEAALRLGVALRGRALDPRAFLLGG